MSQWRDSNPRPADYKSAALANWATLAIKIKPIKELSPEHNSVGLFFGKAKVMENV